MSVPVAPPRPPARLADLDAARADWARVARGGTWSNRVSLLFVVFVLGAQTYVGVWDPVVGGVLLLGLVAVHAGLPAFAWVRERRTSGLAGGGPSSLTKVRSPADGPELWSALVQALEAEGFSHQWLTDPHTLSCVRGSGLARQYFVTVRVEPFVHGGALVTVWARPNVEWWGAPPDLGRSRRFANTVLEAVPGATPVA